MCFYLLDDLRSDGLAWSAPGGEAVEDDDVVLLERSLELSLAVIRKIVSTLLIDPTSAKTEQKEIILNREDAGRKQKQ